MDEETHTDRLFCQYLVIMVVLFGSEGAITVSDALHSHISLDSTAFASNCSCQKLDCVLLWGSMDTTQ